MYPILLPVFFFISALYSSVGLGGGSAYIAALVFAGVPDAQFPIIALGCNLIVAGLGFFHYRREGHFRLRLFWPFAIASMPLAYLGGRLKIPEPAFDIILAVALVIAAVRLIFWKGRSKTRSEWQDGVFIRTPFLILIGAILGFLSGITGIGGGIYLIPVLLFLGFSTPKEAGAVASLFIVVNSAFGLAGQLSKGFVDLSFFLPFAVVVFAGGFIGSRMGSTLLKGETLQKIVGIIILVAVGKIVAGRL